MTRFNSILLKIILSLASCIVVLLILEAAVRIFFSENKPRMIAKKPSEATLVSLEYTISIKRNPEGFRDIEHKLRKPEGVFRILVIGDSFTFGMGVEADQAYPFLLEQLLNNRNAHKGVKYEVFNMGLVGMSTLEEINIVKRGLRYQPDLVLLGILLEDRWNSSGNGNDLYDNFMVWHRSKPEGPSDKNQPVSRHSNFKNRIVVCLNSVHYFLAKNSHLYYLIMSKNGAVLRSRLVSLREGENRQELAFAWDITRDAIKKIDLISRMAGVEFVVIRIPFLYDVYSKDEDRASKILSDFGRENNARICDLLPFLQNNKDKDLYYPADGHWKAEAHVLAAGKILNYLIDEKLIK